jgi:eukaryotic-like serine/threonine-protein kinase
MQGDGRLDTRETRTVGGETALYEQWQITCAGTTLTQRLWYLPRLQLVIVDEWGIPDLDGILATATFP